MNSDQAHAKSNGLGWLLPVAIAAAMVVLSVTAILIPTRIGKDINPRTPCLANLRTIEGAKLTWALENHKLTNDIPGESDLFGEQKYVRQKPLYIAGGIYTIGPIGKKPRCSIPGHTL